MHIISRGKMYENVSTSSAECFNTECLLLVFYYCSAIDKYI